MSSILITVIICTHNPRSSYISRVLQSLKTQTLSLSKWELILVDNASQQSLDQMLDLAWHPHSSIIHEEKLGLTHARLCGIRHAKAKLIVFVDDDNVLTQNYLSTVLQIDQTHPMLGAWGGQCLPEFEEEPPTWTKSYWTRVGIKEFNQDYWSHHMNSAATPIGAGMCVRKCVADKYVELVKKDSRRSELLGRKGNQLLGCEDLDLAWTSGDLDLGTGVFTSLKLTHLIPKSRLQESYLIKATQGSDYSEVILQFLRNNRLTWKQKLRLWMPWLMPPQLWFIDDRAKRFYQAGVTGRCLALKDISQGKFTSQFKDIQT